MRSYNPNEPDDVKEAARIGAEPWMLDVLALNPESTLWTPSEMKDGRGWWNDTFICETWTAFDVVPNERNEIVNFYFFVNRPEEDCNACEVTGYAPEAYRLYVDFYDAAGTGRRWSHKLTADDVQALVGAGRLSSPVVDAEFVAQINGANAPASVTRNLDLEHDAMNVYILIRNRCKRLGIPLNCPICQGHGKVVVGESAQLALALWMLHPGKSAARSIVVQRLTMEEVPKALRILRDAALRNAERFSRALAALA